MRSVSRGALVIGGVVVAVLVGSLIYWLGEGSPGTPEQFRTAVADAGLDVDWSNNGPTGGDGVVVSECGDQEVTVNEVGGELWVRWGSDRAVINSAVIDQITSCG